MERAELYTGTTIVALGIEASHTDLPPQRFNEEGGEYAGASNRCVVFGAPQGTIRRKTRMPVNPALRIFEDGSEIRTLPGLEVVKRKLPRVQGRLKLLGHLHQELLIELRRQAHIVPHIRIVLNELIELEHARDVITCVVAGIFL